MLTVNRLRELLDYDSNSGHFVWLISRSRSAKAGDRAGYVNGEGYVLIGIDGRIYKAHRLAWLFVHGAWPEHEIDHINCSKTDNRLTNLREATRQANAENIQRPRKSNAAGILGVRAYRNRWRAEIRINGKQKQIGTFNTAEAAQAAYVAAKRANHKGCTL